MEYYHWVRREIEPLLPRNLSRVLEVGAGAGSTLKWIKALHPKSETTAVEINSSLLPELKRNVDIPFIGPIEETLPQLETYDLILLLDVLEHLSDPTVTLRNLSKHLDKHGQIIVSVPNVAHLSVSIPLLLQRRFQYQDAGILDRTHLRFFVESTAIELLNSANFIVTAGLISGIQGPRSKLLNRLSFGTLRHHLAKQYIMLGQLSDGNSSQERIAWKAVE
jgi:2-polyprenyl-3-methyl-5-hydroxy-6-metoxy-1,4-benzoquinol methylase